jgi:transglutaminase/protease-like cytokinesis protein 3
VVGGIIAKLPPSWMDFSTTLKHKRQEFSVAKLIGSLEVEERARAKDTRGKEVETSSANMVQKKNSNTSHNNKKRTSNKITQSPSRQPRLKGRTKVLVALFAGVLITGQVLVQTANLSKRKN